MREEGPVARHGRALPNGSRRAQRGAMAARVLLALCTATTVTLAVAGPLAYQAHEARDSPVISTEEPTRPTTTTEPEGPPALVAGATTTAPDDPAPDGSPTTTTPAPSPPRPGPTVVVPGGGPPITVAPPAVPTTTTPGGGGVAAPPPTTAPQPPTSTTTTTIPSPSPAGLVWATRWSEDVQAEPLHGAVVDGRICILFAEREAVRVAFYLDDPNAQEGPLNVETRWPFSLVRGPNEMLPGTLDTSGLSVGQHSVRADITWQDGRTEVRLATFTVSR